MFVDWVREEVEKGTAGGRRSRSRSLGRTPRRPRDGYSRNYTKEDPRDLWDPRDHLRDPRNRDPRDYVRDRSFRRNAYPERRGGRFVY